MPRYIAIGEAMREVHFLRRSRARLRKALWESVRRPWDFEARQQALKADSRAARRPR